MKRRAWMTAGIAGALLVACSSSSSSSSSGLQASDAQAIADMLFNDAAASGANGVSPASFGAAPVRPYDSCSPQKLTPVQQCASGGDVYTTINQTCPDANAGACCAANPPSCTQFKATFSGQYKTLFNGCKTSANVEEDGTIDATMTGSIQETCGGLGVVALEIHWNGSFDVRVDGQDACPDGISVTLVYNEYDHVEMHLYGTVCGWSVRDDRVGPPAVQCDGFGCPAGSYCGKCNHACFPTSYPVDCCTGACPSGTQCAANNKCTAG